MVRAGVSVNAMRALAAAAMLLLGCGKVSVTRSDAAVDRSPDTMAVVSDAAPGAGDAAAPDVARADVGAAADAATPPDVPADSAAADAAAADRPAPPDAPASGGDARRDATPPLDATSGPDLCPGAPGMPAGTRCGCGAEIDCSGACRPAGTCNALAFDGVSGMVTTATTTQPALGASGTMEAWVQVRSNAANAYIFRKSRANVEDKALLLEVGYTRAYFYLGDGTYAQVISRTVVPLQAWTHIAAVYDGATMRLYLNGQLTDTAPAAGGKAVANADGEVTIGGRPDIFNGVISDVRISSSARYTANFTPAPLLAADARTLSLWHLDEGVGTTTTDVGSARLIGTLMRASATAGPRWVAATPRP